jgi:hypothetical protein
MPNLLKELDKRNKKSKPKLVKNEFGLKVFIYRKLYSLNPDLYKEIELDSAYVGYTEYLRYCMESREADLLKAKTFKEWLESEI